MANMTALQAMQAEIAALKAQLALAQTAGAPLAVKPVAGISQSSKLPYRGVQLTGPGKPVYIPLGFALGFTAAVKADPAAFISMMEQATSAAATKTPEVKPAK